METQIQARAGHREQRIGDAGDKPERAARAEQFDPADIIRVGDDRELQGRFRRQIGAAEERRECRAQSPILDEDILGEALLGSDVAPFIDHGGQLMKSIGLGGGI